MHLNARSFNMKPRKVTNHGKSKWVVQFTDNGRRKRKYFDKKFDALEWIHDREKATISGGVKVADLVSNYSSATDLAKAIQLLEPTGASILEAVTYYLENRKKRDGITVNDIVKDFMADKISEGIKPRTIQEYSGDEAGKSWKKGKGRLGAFMKHFDQRPLPSIEREEIEAYLAKYQNPTTYNHHLRVINTFYNRAYDWELIESIPTKATKKRKVAHKTPQSYTAAQILKLLELAPTPQCEMAIAFGALAGLRPEAELERLNWAYVNLNEMTIQILAGMSKNMKSQRFVRIGPRLKTILGKYAKSSGKVVSQKFITSKEWKNFKSSWPFKPIKDGLRHTFATMHVAAYRNLGETSMQLGHNGNTDMLKSNYWNSAVNINQSEAVSFFEELPPTY